MAAISAVFTISHVTDMLGDDEDWLKNLSINTFPEDGCLWVQHGLGEDGAPAFTEYGIECLQQIIAEKRADGIAPKPTKTE